MKKILSLIIISVCSGLLFANDFSWADYEAQCFKRGAEPSYEKWEELVENPQCYGDSVEEITKLFNLEA